MKKIILTIFVVFTFVNSTFASSGGSLYSRYGIGDLYLPQSGLHLSLGGYGSSLYNSRYLNLVNPAALTSIKNTRFGAGLNTNISFLDDGNASAVYSHVKFQGFQIAFPVKETWGIGFMMGMTPYSVVNYDVVNNVKEANTALATSKEMFKGTGGISKLFFGFSYLLPGDISFGASLNYFSGDIRYQSSFTYSNTSKFFDSNFTSEYKFRGMGGSLGLISPDFAKVFKMKDVSNFRLGFSYEFNGKINTDTAIVTKTVIGTNSSSIGRDYTVLPSKLSMGLNLTISDKYLLVLDYTYQPWSKFELNGIKSNSLQDLTRYSLGFEVGEQTRRFASFWELVKYRGGLSYEQSQYKINGTGINQIGIHAGISFPLGQENSIDLGFMYGIRGDNTSGLIRENIFQATISLNFGEFWFIRREW